MDDTAVRPMLAAAMRGDPDVATIVDRLRKALAFRKINLTREQEAEAFGAALRGTPHEGTDLTPYLIRPPAPPRQIPPGADPASGWTWARWNALPNQGTAQNPMRILLDKNGNPVRVYGKLKGSSKTPGHFEAMRNQAIRLAYSGEYSEIHFQHGWGTVTGEPDAINLQPDVLALRRQGGVVDAWEAISKNDPPNELTDRMTRGMDSLPEKRRGTMGLLDPEP